MIIIIKEMKTSVLNS